MRRFESATTVDRGNMNSIGSVTRSLDAIDGGRIKRKSPVTKFEVPARTRPFTVLAIVPAKLIVL